jgi:hypothetical protein
MHVDVYYLDTYYLITTESESKIFPSIIWNRESKCLLGQLLFSWRYYLKLPDGYY